MLPHPLAAALLLACGASQAALLCEAAPCRVELQFGEGGAIEAPAGVTISFGPGGLLDLGGGGSIDYGSGGGAEPATTGTAVPDLSAGGRIVLGPGGSIHFGDGGRLLGGDTAQVEAPDGAAVEFRAARRVEIDSEASVHVGTLSRFEQVLLEGAQVNVGSAPAPFRFGGTTDGDFSLRSAGTAWVESLDDSSDGRNDGVVISAPGDIEAGGGSAPPSSDGSITVGGDTSAPPGAGGIVVVGGGPASPSVEGPISAGGGTVETTGGSVTPGTITVTEAQIQPLDSGNGGGAFPGLLLALFAALGCARRARR